MMKHFRTISYHVAFLIFVAPVAIAYYAFSLIGNIFQLITIGMTKLLLQIFFNADRPATEQPADLQAPPPEEPRS